MSFDTSSTRIVVRALHRASFLCIAPLTSACIVSAHGNSPLPNAPLAPYTNAWNETFQPDSGAPIGPFLWEDRLDSVTWHGHAAMRRTQIEHRPSGSITTVNVFDPATMTPQMSEQHRSDGLFWHYEYDGRRVREIRSTLRPGSAPVQPPGAHIDTLRRTFDLREPIYDFFGGMYGILLPRRHLAIGVRDSFPALLQARDSIVQVSYQVTDRVRMSAGSLGSVDAWVVEMPLPGGGLYRSWISPAPPYIIRLASPQKSPPGLWSWDMP